ncbi:hypothetical protein WICPIJ_003792 [Wickerhamomyces pijperi]|uniref:Uncharacterized protein n=1 Tax=Wickerhamomyces pijperi TaxID=599730 RepID=A0A9P8TMP9_WICPI|nr:hypothetical protein WICPIJ_003792 [Wickerhamomyces pijperi]
MRQNRIIPRDQVSNLKGLYAGVVTVQVFMVWVQEAFQGIKLLLRHVVGKVSDTEICDLAASVVIEKHILRFQVSVDVASVMHELHTQRNLLEETELLSDGTRLERRLQHHREHVSKLAELHKNTPASGHRGGGRNLETEMSRHDKLAVGQFGSNLELLDDTTEAEAPVPQFFSLPDALSGNVNISVNVEAICLCLWSRKSFGSKIGNGRMFFFSSSTDPTVPLVWPLIKEYIDGLRETLLMECEVGFRLGDAWPKFGEAKLGTFLAPAISLPNPMNGVVSLVNGVGLMLVDALLTTEGGR